ncbi:MAG: HigA family addiction module antitoxin [Verrucomicrobiales bacterium]
MKALRKFSFQPDYAVAPGATLEETMEALGLTQRDFARRLGLTVQSLNRIFKGEQPITSETAVKLERVTGTAAAFWNNLESQYRQQLQKAEVVAPDSKVVAWVQQFDYPRMASLGWVTATRKIDEKIEHLLAFFGVAGVAEWEATHLSTLNQGAYRRAAAVKEHRPETTAWIQRGMTIARGLAPVKYDAARFKEAVEKARALATEPPLAVARQLEDLYREAGVALVFIDTLPGMGVHAFTRWNKGQNTAVIVHGLRHKTNDLFWFDLFHESAHILLHGRSHEFLEYDGSASPREVEANNWAGRLLIPDRDWQRFIASTTSYSATAIRAFAEGLKLHPASVVGRLQKEKRLRPDRHVTLKLFLTDHIDAITTSPARRRIRYDRLGTGAAFIRRNRGAIPDLESIRDSITAAEYADLRR